jgi:hypothetical protein
MLHYNPRHVSSINMPIFRRTNCIITASGIVILWKRLYSMPDESGRASFIVHCNVLSLINLNIKPISSEFLTSSTNLLLTYLLTYLRVLLLDIFSVMLIFPGTFASHFWICLTWLPTHFRRCILLGTQNRQKSDWQTNLKWMKFAHARFFPFLYKNFTSEICDE